MLRLDTDVLRHFRTRLPLSVSIGTLVSLLLAFVASALLLLDQHYGRGLALDQATRNFEQIGRAVGLEIANAVVPIEGAVDATAALVERLDDKAVVAEQSFGVLAERVRRTANLYALYYGDADGNFILVIRPDMNAAASDRDDGAAFEAWIIRRKARGEFEQRVYRLDAAGRPLSIDDRYHNGYDPRLRDWYRLAMESDGVVQTAPYVFFGANEIGLTLARRLSSGRGVVGGDVTLSTIGGSLARHRLSESFRTVVFERRGDVIASDEGDWVTAVERRDDRWIVRRHTLGSIGDPVTSALSKLVASGFGTGLARLRTTDRGEWTAWLHDIGSGALSGRRLAILAPSRELYAEVDRRALVGAAIAMPGIVLGLVLAWRIGRAVARPVARLTEDAARLAAFDLAKRPRLHSVVSEVVQLDEALHAMREALRSFATYVPRQLVRLLVTGRVTAGIGGQRREVTLLFTDITGFTTIAETVDAIDLTRDISDYLGRLSGTLIGCGATVDKFIGDAVMAFWNAPDDQPRHPAMACRGALRARHAVDQLNAGRRQSGLPEFATRFGLNTGIAVVGTVGSEERANYTALGAAVNLAARLERMNKIFGTQILISDSVFAQLGPEFVTRPVDIVLARGMLSATRIHELIGLRGGDPEIEPDHDCVAMASSWRDAAALYEMRDWVAARDAVATHLRRWPGDGVAVEMRGRIDRYVTDPPPADWDGIERTNPA